MAQTTVATRAVERARAAFADLANDPAISDALRLRLLGDLAAEIEGLILDVRALLPERPRPTGDPPPI
jgi:hypothetical protein